MKLFTEKIKKVVMLDETRCDICGRRVDHEEHDSYSRRRVKISYEHGNVYPDDYNCNRFEPDICSECFREKIYPVIVDLLKKGAKPWSKWINDENYHDIMEETVRTDA